MIAEIKQFCELLLGCPQLPEPELDLAAFVRAVEQATAELPAAYDPLRSAAGPWIKTRKLQGGGSLGAMLGACAGESICIVS